MTKEEIKELIFRPVQVRDKDDDEWQDAEELLGFTELSMYKYSVLIEEGGIVKENIFKQMRPIQKKKWLDWTPETAPFPLALRKKAWPKGSYQIFDVHADFVSGCINGHILYYSELNTPDSEWETRDGKRCGTEVSE